MSVSGSSSLPPRDPFRSAQNRLNQSYSHISREKNRVESAEAKEHIELLNEEWRLRQKNKRLEEGVKKLNEDIAELSEKMATKGSRIDNLEAQMTDQIAENKALRVQMEAQSKRMDQLMAMLEAQNKGSISQ